MNMKNANFFQKHVEKLILGGAILIALLIILTYAVGSPYTAKIGNQEMGPRKVEEHVQQQAQDLAVRLRTEQPQFEPPQIAPYSEELVARLDAQPAPRDQFAMLWGVPGISVRDIGIEAPRTPFDLPRPPVPTDIKATSSFAVLGTFEESAEREAYVQLVGEKTPWDIRYVSVSAEWPVREWEQRLQQSDLPTSFWRSMIGITSVYLQRQELDPATGEWVNTTLVPSLPRQIAARPGQDGDYTDETATQFVRFLREQQANVARPPFPPLAHGEWLPPGSDFMNLTLEEQQRLKRVRQDINSLEKRLDTLRRSLERQAQIQERRAGRSTPPPTTRRGGAPDDLGEGMPMRELPQTTGRGQDAAAEIERITRELQQKRNEYNELVGVPQDNLTDATQTMDPYGEFDPMMGGYPGEMPPAPPGARAPYGRTPWGQQPQRPGQPYPNQQPQQAAPAEDESIRVWAHDLTVEPGKTYRYRVLVSVFNPLFRQTRVEENQRAEFFNQVALAPDEQELAASPWSDNVVVDPEFYFFYLSGNVAGQVATVEVWHIYNGLLHRDNFQLSPGDPIGGTSKIQVNGVEQPLNMTTGAVMVDLVASGGSGFGGDTRLLYYDPNREAIATRSSRQDEDSPLRTRLENLRSVQQQQQAVASSASVR